MSTILPGNQDSAALALDGGAYGLFARRQILSDVKPRIRVTKAIITTNSSTNQYWFYYNLTIGGVYKIDFVSNGARVSGYIRVEIVNNGSSPNTYADSGSVTLTYNTRTVNRISVYLSGPGNGTITLTITETIN